MYNREIGSEFWDIPVSENTNSCLNKEIVWFLSGRSALLAIIYDIKQRIDFHTVAIPFWCCESIIKPFFNNGIKIKFYKDQLPDADVAIVMDFFGFSRPENYINDFNGIIIRDITHSAFSSKHNDSDYYFGSLRKWAGFWTGGYAWGFKRPIHFQDDEKACKYIELRKEAMSSKYCYIQNLSREKDGKNFDKSFLGIFSEAEDLLDYIGICRAANRDIDCVKFLDINFIRNKRRANAKMLIEAFTDLVIWKNLSENDCPLFVPIRIKSRDRLRRFLIEKEIYCPIHWPISKYHNLDDSSNRLYAEELSLVCDQRYNESDMRRIIETITYFLAKGA